MTAWFRVRAAAVCLVMAGLLAPPVSRSQEARPDCPNLVANGNFSADGGSLDGWTFNQNTDNFYWTPVAIGTTTYAQAGCFGVACISGTEAEQNFLYQTLTTEPGKFYTLTFTYNAGGGGINELKVVLGQRVVEDLVNIAQGANTYTVRFHASERRTLLNFLARQDNAFSFLTAVSMTRDR